MDHLHPPVRVEMMTGKQRKLFLKKLLSDYCRGLQRYCVFSEELIHALLLVKNSNAEKPGQEAEVIPERWQS